MTRRKFSQFVSKIFGTVMLLIATGTSALFMSGCNVFDDILNWIPVGLTAIGGIVAVLGPLVPPGSAAIITIIKAVFADLQAAVIAYKNDTNPADKATLLAKIRTFLNDIVINFQSFLAALNLGNNPIVAIVIGLASVILAAIAGFMGQLPTTAGRTTIVTTSVSVGGKVVTVAPKYYKHTSDFKKDYNAICAQYGHTEIELH